MHILRFINITIKYISIVYVNRLVNISITGLIMSQLHYSSLVYDLTLLTFHFGGGIIIF